MNCALIGLTVCSTGVFLQAGDVRAVQQGDPAHSADILAALPADTVAVLSLRNLGEFDARVSKLLEGIGLPVSPIALFKGSLGIVAGLDDSGPAATAIFSRGSDSSETSGIVLLLPTSDPEALLTLLEPQPVEDGLVRVKLRGRESYATAKGGLTVFGPDPVVVRHIVDTKTRLSGRLSGRQTMQGAEADASLWVNVKSLSTGALAEDFRLWLKDRFGVGAEALANLESIQFSLRVHADRLAVNICATRSSAATTGDAGVQVGSRIQAFEKESHAAMIRLTNDVEGGRVGAVLDRFVSRLTASGLIDPARSAAVRVACQPFAKGVAELAVSLAPLSTSAGGRVSAAMVIRSRGDGREFLGDIERMVTALAGDMVAKQTAGRRENRVRYRRAAETAGTVILDHLSIDPTGYRGLNSDALREVTGPEGLLVRIGAVDERAVVLTFGGSLPRFLEVAQAVRGTSSAEGAMGSRGKDRGSEEIRPWFEASLSPGRGAAYVRELAGLFGGGINLPDVPDTASPLTIALSTPSPREWVADIDIPLDMVIAIKNVMIQRVAGGGSPSP